MGPYCKFCGRRCFVPILEGCPERVAKAYGRFTIAATCSRGRAYERDKFGLCYADVMDVSSSGGKPVSLKTGKATGG